MIVETTHPDSKHAPCELALISLRRILKDYFLICDSYYQAIRTAPPSRIQAIDMGRRGLHDDEGPAEAVAGHQASEYTREGS